jgi:FMN phosphatase YigB (HAD superfamily)
MGIAHHFDAVITSVELGWRNPHPASYAEALHRLGITAANAVFAGDTYLADYAGPLGAGIAAFLIDLGEQHEVPADRRLRSLRDLPGRLGSMIRAAHRGRPWPRPAQPGNPGPPPNRSRHRPRLCRSCQ